MSIPELPQLERAVRKIVRRAKKEGQLKTLTPRIIRQEVEQAFSLDEGSLNTKDYKNSFKQATTEALNSDYESDGSHASQGDKKANKRKPVEQEVQHVVKKAKVEHERKSSVGKSDAPQPKKRTGKDSKAYKSSAVVQSSDVEPEEEALPESQSVSTSSHNAKMGVTLPDDNKPSSSHAHSKDAVSIINAKENTFKSESELSVLIDEPPKRSKKSKTKEKESGKSKNDARQKKQKNAGAALSKDEETLKRLKSIVVACGVRKMWKREFQDLDTPSQQIKRVKEILTSLGMSGRFSLEQARAIKEERELAQELEDVQSFEKTVVSGQSSSQSKTKQAREESISDDDDSETGEAPTKRKSNARLSIMAFLGDQSDED